MNCLRYRMDVRQNVSHDIPTVTSESHPVRSLRSKKTAVVSTQRANKASLYDTLLRLIGEFDASGRAEIFRLLLERRSTIPLFLPNGENHLAVLSLLNKTIDCNQTVCIGEDLNLLRVAVISCRKKEDSKASELLKEVFHLNSLHREDFSRRSVTCEPITADIGLGCVLPLAENKDPAHHMLVLNVVGDFDQLWDFVKDFSDYLIIEDATHEEERFYRRPQFSNYKGDPSCPGLEGINSVLVWKPSLDGLIADFQEGNDNLFGFEHLEVKASLSKELYDNLVSDLLDLNVSDLKTAKLHQMTSLLPAFQLKEVECRVPFDIKALIGKVKNFSKLRSESFVLQKSFKNQAKYEEEKAQNRNDESIRDQMNYLIRQQVELRKEKTQTVEKHPLLELILNLLHLEDVSLRVLGFREFEKSLAQQSENALGPIRVKIDKYSIQYAELSQSKSRHNDGLDKVSKQLQCVKAIYNTTVVSTEHVWRELSHLYAANPSKYSELLILIRHHFYFHTLIHELNFL